MCPFSVQNGAFTLRMRFYGYISLFPKALSLVLDLQWVPNKDLLNEGGRELMNVVGGRMDGEWVGGRWITG